MDPSIHLGQSPIAESYSRFAAREAVSLSPIYMDWAQRVSLDEQIIQRLETLPHPKRQPNLVFAAARWHGAHTTYDSFRATLLQRWPQVRCTILARATQTNEAGRCAVLLPYLANLPQPLALLEVGASAGLCLLPDFYSYRYDNGPSLDPDDGPSDVILPCRLGAGVPEPAMPDILWRAGIDLAPVDVTSPDECAWLETLVWPGQEDRRARLGTAVALARMRPPRLVRGDLNEALPALASEAPADATLVVFHTAVLVYLQAEDRSRFVETVTNLQGHWISNEGQSVVDLPHPFTTTTHDDGRFLLSVDGIPHALTDPHGAAIDALPACDRSHRSRSSP
ncbi:DUF2332 domain-containing protein [Tessaracoccus antarcticus]|uniref:DUF2332 domain-containing protein n=1 Tax=Tessaracoccus antarcticus TaxID=2479848 RepID=UPI001F22B39F|nr:DUF2332 domain-containing protein [Tessaracoccus antarcticus]